LEREELLLENMQISQNTTGGKTVTRCC